MSDAGYQEMTLDAVVTGAAEDTARALGLTIDPGAIDLLLNASRRRIDEAYETKIIESRRKEIEHNTDKLIRYMVQDLKEFDSESSVITFANFNKGLAAFCRFFPNFYPFCPYP